MRLATLFASLVAAAVASPVLANDGMLDEAFGTDAEFPGFGFYQNPYGTALGSQATVMRQAPNGQLLLLGQINDGADTQRIALHRLDADGYPDFGFGDAGLRTYPRPCGAGSHIVDAQVDAQGRVWVAFGGCPDFTVYRFLPNGEPDTSLLGSGVLTVPFDLGDDNIDTAARIELTPQGGVVIAGFAAALPARHLAVAHYTGDGQPQPGFGTDGKADFVVAGYLNALKGLHLMDDGRIVLTGRYAQNPLDTKLSVMRLQPSGAADIGFGNVVDVAGLAHADIGNLLGDASKRVTGEASLLLPDGSIVQVGGGKVGGPHSSYDFSLVKWRPDGQLDTTIGAVGMRSWSLDFAGPMPASDDHNFDEAKAVLRQGDGKLVLIGRSYAADNRSGLSAIRLTRTLELDPGFGDGGKLRHLSAIHPNDFDCTRVATALLQPGRIVAAATMCGSADMQGSVGMVNDLLFADGFE